MNSGTGTKNGNVEKGNSRHRLIALSIGALGVVYGDIGTSPLYAVRECFHGEYGILPNQENVLGVLSLMFWALVVIVCTKYLTFILRADNNGEGGIIALVALVGRALNLGKRRRLFLLMIGLFAASLLYGDGMITPAISVLSAVEGLRIAAPGLEPYVIPLTVVILILIFLLQRKGTKDIGFLFGPVMAIWFSVIAILGISSLIHNPKVLLALSPLHGVRFLAHNSWHGFLVLGAVFLVVTGAEALYADLGHFGRRPIRISWFAVAFPALLCNYFGQGALLLAHPEEAHHPFYALAPAWSIYPLILLSTAATIIASQATISGAFSLTRQAVQLGYLPRFRIVHTSATEIGQVYIPQVNWLLMIATIVLVLGFQTSSKLAAAYGVAVTTTMLIATVLFYFVAREKWKWSRLRAGSLIGVFLVVDLSFFGANLVKIAHGAWFPLAIGGVIYILMTTWRKGRALLAAKLYSPKQSIEEFIDVLAKNPPLRVPGKAVYLAGRPDLTPPALLHNLKHNKVLHSQVAVLSVITENVPVVPRDEKIRVRELGSGFYCVIAKHGFMEEPNVPYFLALAREKGLDFDISEVSFVLGRERLLPERHRLMAFWQESIFAFVSHNTVGPTAYFHLPPDQVLEIGSQMAI